MTEHLPECPSRCTEQAFCACRSAECICDALRACEDRVRSNPDWTSHILLDELERCLALARKEWEVQVKPEFVSIADYRTACKWAYDKGLEAAREAIRGAASIDIASGRALDEPAQFIWLNNALSAIDELRAGS